MGTRSFIGVIHEGKYKIAQYCQWDGYPEGQGARVLDFLSHVDLKLFKEKLNNCRFIKDSEIRNMYVAAGDDPNNKSGFISMEVGNRFSEMFPSLSRDTGAEVLSIVYESANEVPLYNREDFIEDEVWCEFAYVINLDKETLHCYVNGKKVFAEYLLEELPTVEELSEACEKYYMTHNS